MNRRKDIPNPGFNILFHIEHNALATPWIFQRPSFAVCLVLNTSGGKLSKQLAALICIVLGISSLVTYGGVERLSQNGISI
jgi:hypothetical protein